MVTQMSYSKTPESSNTAARITLRKPTTEHTMPLLRMLHWLGHIQKTSKDNTISAECIR